MRAIPDNLAKRLALGTTQLAHAWVMRLRDGTVLGFTDHDSDIMVEGTRCVATTGLDVKDMTSEIGLAAGGGEVLGALQAAALREIDIVNGAYDGAEVRFFLCDCEAPYDTILIDVATIGEIKRDETAFIAELRGLAHKLSEETGRTYLSRCDAEFGDERCGMDRKRTDLSITGSVSGLLAAGRFRIALDRELMSGSLINGTLIFDKWPGRNFAIKFHSGIQNQAMIELWLMPEGVATGDRFTAVVGCDKSFETCQRRFGNAINFRGFPHMPGNEIVLTMIQDGEPGYDGGSLFNG